MSRYIWIKVVIDHPATSLHIQRISKASPMIPAPNITAGSQSCSCSHLRRKQYSYWSRWKLACSARASSVFAHNGICQQAASDREFKIQPSSQETMQQLGCLWEMCKKKKVTYISLLSNTASLSFARMHICVCECVRTLWSERMCDVGSSGQRATSCPDQDTCWANRARRWWRLEGFSSRGLVAKAA